MLCISVIFPAYSRPMIFFPRKFLLLLTIPLLTQCGSLRTAPQTQTVTGPYNSRGDYVEDWVDQPDKWYRPPAPGTPSKPNTTIVSNTRPLPEPHIPLIETTSPPPIVRTSPTTVKPKPKPKPPAVVRHTVKRGDTLSSIAKRYKTTVSKIQTANGIRGSVIRVGQNLKIPR
jgi:nucleoid-associated protein YgaU